MTNLTIDEVIEALRAFAATHDSPKRPLEISFGMSHELLDYEKDGFVRRAHTGRARFSLTLVGTNADVAARTSNEIRDARSIHREPGRNEFEGRPRDWVAPVIEYDD